MSKITKSIYRILFVNQGKLYELYARSIYQGELYGFIEVEELLFGERSSVLVNPAEERLQSEFAGVRRTFIPLHYILRIDEVEREGISKIRPVEGGDNVMPFPQPLVPPGGGRDKD
ncbi:MAG: DUF1820 family protein [Candidatus Competibacteraceae bacterium]|nr:DUF1820 family protein [Candidatus Competibacteraceae bacterium]MBK7983225.1 DUF1820 family protein [Candidatus Competibacteraceae bacterium]MBK8898227.1 DUF1820 family protein [Candidatus Competibacteraceae bacterium]MBK8962034.1 DUF1820 family protein [Candidatus Competibacteraceae bacterium]MBK9951249.1 DUF1820 family protein [Candidatus Competibacteraceae bacterium]